MIRPALTALALALALTGCKPAPAPSGPEATPPQSLKTQPPPLDAGSITGTILFKGKPPAPLTIDTSMDPACALGSAAATLPVEQVVTHAGKLANVFLYIKSGPPAAMHAAPATAAPAIMDQQHCRYVPHVLGVIAGGTVEFRNSDPTMHNIHTMPTQVGNETVDVSQAPRGAPQSKQFRQPEFMLPVRCNNHPWMSAFVNVSATPFFAVSDASGNFTITGLQRCPRRLRPRSRAREARRADPQAHRPAQRSRHRQLRLWAVTAVRVTLEWWSIEHRWNGEE